MSSTGIISAKDFFANNGLFKLLQLKKGDLSRSYKTSFQHYKMECENCEQQVKQAGNAAFECRRCRYKVAPTIDNDGLIIWQIDEPTGLQKKRAAENMLKPAKVIDEESEDDVPVKQKATVKKNKKLVVVNDTESESEEEEEAPKPPSKVSMIDFLKKTAPKISGERILTRNKARREAEAADIDEPIVPAKTALPQKPKEVIPKEKAADKCTPVVREETMKVVRLKPGQSHYCAVTGRFGSLSLVLSPYSLMNKRAITKVFNEVELEKFTPLPIERMKLLSDPIRADAAGDKTLADALDLYLSLILTKPALKKLKAKKVSVIWGARNEIDPVIDKVEVYRYGKSKYLVMVKIVDGE